MLDFLILQLFWDPFMLLMQTLALLSLTETVDLGSIFQSVFLIDLVLGGEEHRCEHSSGGIQISLTDYLTSLVGEYENLFLFK